MPIIYSLYPAYVGTATAGHSRVDTYTSRWERLFHISPEYRDFTWLRVKSTGAPEALTGQVLPTYDELTTQGLLISKGTGMPAFAIGVVMTEDAVFLTLDPVGVRGKKAGYLDRILDPITLIRYEVNGVQRNNDPKAQGLAFYTVQLHRLELEE